MPVGPTELIIIGLIIVLLFGAKRLPDTARAIGRSLRIFKSETTKLRDDDDSSPKPQTAQPASESAPLTGQVLTEGDRIRKLEEENARLRAAQSTPAPHDVNRG
ncbi:sec-independent protein translocase protein TatA [Sinosporangium album]|uniref:Sec-independent protein translocase protein TatA n=1 Tax=Sinosporangium album TaxID=504805 RepID=A0A1G8I473_9ACTN|nr:Sec-independent protein translocase subunit TatA [Sinosporangium album]SDI13654.1 sec-independent protein translocase protein TatA [Sinosporangium album]